MYFTEHLVKLILKSYPRVNAVTQEEGCNILCIIVASLFTTTFPICKEHMHAQRNIPQRDNFPLKYQSTLQTSM